MCQTVSMRRCFKSRVSRHFRRSNLKANKVSKSEGTRKIVCACHFCKCADAVYPKLLKLGCSTDRYMDHKCCRFISVN